MADINPQVVVSAASGQPPGTSRNEAEVRVNLVDGSLFVLRKSSPTAVKIGPNASGSGTVTNNEGALAFGQVIVGNGGADEQTLGTYGTSGQLLTSAGPGLPPVWAPSASAVNFVDGEIPSGLVNGANTSFTLAHLPIAGSPKIYLNGIRQQAGGDYTLAGATIAMASAPGSGDILLADYRF